MNKKWFALLLGCLALSLVAAGCGGDDDNGGGGQTAAQTTTEQTTTEQTETSAGGGGGKEVEVKMENIQFNPKDITVKKGGKVKWVNEDSAPHDVTKASGPGADFSSGNGNLNKGDDYEQTFDTAGTIEYKCTVHPGMTGTIKVE
jgi:plastocyanin